MTGQEKEKFDEKFHALFFGVRRSVRYHTRRRQFFDKLSIWADFIIIISGGTVVGVTSSGGTSDENKFWAILFGAIIAIIGSLDLVIGFSGKARDHHDLAREFANLEREMVAAGGNPTETHFIDFTNSRIKIEEEEPPKLCVLDTLCHNELIESSGYDEKYKKRVNWFHSMFAQVSDFWWCPSKPKIPQEKIAQAV